MRSSNPSDIQWTPQKAHGYWLWSSHKSTHLPGCLSFPSGFKHFLSSRYSTFSIYMALATRFLRKAKKESIRSLRLAEIYTNFAAQRRMFPTDNNCMINKERLPGFFAYVNDTVICSCISHKHDQNLRKFPEESGKYGLTFSEDESSISMKTIYIIRFEVFKGHIRAHSERLEPLKVTRIP